MSQSSVITACPLDCYDACNVLATPTNLKGVSDSHTHGYLCPHLNHFNNYEFIQAPRLDGKEISMDEALRVLQERISKVSTPSQILHYRGSGNFGLMQEVSDHFFASHGATLTEGSLCDGAGEAGILEGRGSNKLYSYDEIARSEVVIVWGRNVHTTSSHLLPLLKDKTIIVIDPVKTKIAEMAEHYIQIKPKGDLYLALLLSRFAIINGLEDEAYLEAFASSYDDFYELTQSVRIKAILDSIDVTLGDIGKILDLIKNKKTMILTGVGIQKVRNGDEVIQAIDGFATIMGFHAKEGCGVNFLGSSKTGIVMPFKQKSSAKVVSKVNAEFGRFEVTFIQGANPLNQMPDTNRVEASLEQCPFVVYFGLYENETSQAAALVIPAKSFLQKDDIRTSYGHNQLQEMPKLFDSEAGISEYALTSYLCNAFDIDLESELSLLEHFQSFGEDNGEVCMVKGRQERPYDKGFDTDDGEYLFLEEYSSDTVDEAGLFLITPKSETSLNSQFKRDDKVYLNTSHGYSAGERLSLSSNNGSVELEVAIDERLRDDCLLVYSGTAGVNRLTDSKMSYVGKSAAYQEHKVKVKKC